MTTFDHKLSPLSLIGGLSIDDFDDQVREKKAQRFVGAIEPDRLAELYSLARLEALMGHDAFPLSQVDVFRGGHLIRLADMQRKSGKSGLDVVTDNFRAGATIRVRDADRFDARLGQFARDVGRRFAARADVNIYLTPPQQAGFPPHFDITDVFIVQCLGAKRWRLFEEYANRVALPLPDTNWDPGRFAPSEASAETIDLAPGDVLYLPRGTMHQTFCLDRESMHLTIGIVSPTFADVLAKLVKAAADSDVRLRQRLPWSAGGDDEPALARSVRRLLVEATERLDVEDLLRAERQAFLLEEPPTERAAALESAIADLLGRAAAR